MLLMLPVLAIRCLSTNVWAVWETVAQDPRGSIKKTESGCFTHL